MRPIMPETNDSLRRWFGALGLVATAIAALAGKPAQAQFPTQLPGALGSGQSGGNMLGALGGGVPSVAHAGTANTAGVLQYCIQNNYLSGGAAGSAKSLLMGKVPGSPQADSGFQAGSSGLLQTGNGKTFNLGGGSEGGGGIKAQVTHKVCDLVLQHAKSLL